MCDTVILSISEEDWQVLNREAGFDFDLYILLKRGFP